MLKKNNKKGFTLAELLIVVAIIAVLTAIAVPLFVGSLTKANKAVEDANKRAVRGYAVSEILSNPAKYDSDRNKETETGTLTGPWFVTATLDKSGNIESVVIALGEEGKQDDGETGTGVYDQAPSDWGSEGVTERPDKKDGSVVKIRIDALS